MTQTDPSQTKADPTVRVAGARIATRLSMTIERLWPLLLPLLIVVALYVGMSWLGLFRLTAVWASVVIAALFLIAAICSLYPIRYFRRPTPAEVDRRIEAANGLRHAPLSAQGDRPSAGTDGFGDALWREHQRRMTARLATVGSDMPRTAVPSRDPWATRSVVALLFFVAFAFSFGPRGGSVADVFRAAPTIAPLPPRIDAWVTPPAYTGKAPIFLTADSAQRIAIFTVPEGSNVALRITGGAGDETATFKTAEGISRDFASAATPASAGIDPKASVPVPATATGTGGAPLQFAGKLNEDGELALAQGGRNIAHWMFSVTPDTPPLIKFTQEPKKAANGALELHYAIVDDYGATAAKSEFALADDPKPDAHPLYGPPEMPLAVPRRGAKDSATKANRDLTEHVWAGSAVNLALTATDGAGHEAKTGSKTIVLPERVFTNPLARALVEFRKILALDTNDRQRVVDLIDAVSLRPEETFDNPSHYLGLMAGLSRLKLSHTDDQLRDVADYFWNMALQIENGDLSTAQKRLAKAQEALKQALRDGASDEEIDKAMKELREAMADFMREFAERAARDPTTAMQQQPGQEMRESDLEKMMDQIENLAKSGNRDQAQQLLSQLQDMMNNLQAQRQQPGQDGQQGEMRKQMNKLGEIMRRQQQMMNETFQLDQQQNGERQQGEQPGDGDQDFQQGEAEQDQGLQGKPGAQGDHGMSPQEFADALKQLQQGQGKLQGDLNQLMESLQGMGMQPGKGFGEAGQAMGEAKGALGESDGNRAVGQQGRALDALRRGAQDMMQQMQQAMQGDQGGGEEGGRQQNSDRDPLGRPRATTGPDFGNSVKVPDEIDIQRARQILEAIRKRLGNTLSPDLERTYLERLLDMR